MKSKFVLLFSLSLLDGCVQIDSERGSGIDYKHSKYSGLENFSPERTNNNLIDLVSPINDGAIPLSSNKASWSEPVRGKVIFDGYKSRKLDRLKYESDSEYAERINVFPNEVYVISSLLSVDYDPETRKISIPLASGSYHLNSFDRYYREKDKITNYYGVKVDSYAKDIGSYTASNAFGASEVVSKTKESKYFVILGENKNIIERSKLELVGSCVASSSEMRNANGMMVVEYIVKPIPPFTFTVDATQLPTISEPYHRVMDYNFLRATPLAARVKLSKSDKFLEGCKAKITAY